ALMNQRTRVPREVHGVLNVDASLRERRVERATERMESTGSVVAVSKYSGSRGLGASFVPGGRLPRSVRVPGLVASTSTGGMLHTPARSSCVRRRLAKECPEGARKATARLPARAGNTGPLSGLRARSHHA